MSQYDALLVNYDINTISMKQKGAKKEKKKKKKEKEMSKSEFGFMGCDRRQNVSHNVQTDEH